jgi:hypothetical protein
LCFNSKAVSWWTESAQQNAVMATAYQQAFPLQRLNKHLVFIRKDGVERRGRMKKKNYELHLSNCPCGETNLRPLLGAFEMTCVDGMKQQDNYL